MFWREITEKQQKEEILEFLRNSGVSLKDFSQTMAFLTDCANSPDDWAFVERAVMDLMYDFPLLPESKSQARSFENEEKSIRDYLRKTMAIELEKVEMKYRIKFKIASRNFNPTTLFVLFYHKKNKKWFMESRHLSSESCDRILSLAIDRPENSKAY